MDLKESGYEMLFSKITAASVRLLGAPTLFEATIVLSLRLRRDARPKLAATVDSLQIQVVPFTERHYHAAVDAYLRYGKGRHPAALNFGDCMAYAVASLAKLPLLYVGKDFAQTDIEAA